MTLMASIVLVVCFQVLSRFVLTTPSSITEEISRCLLLWIGMFGSAFAYRTGQHLGLDIVTRKFSAQWQRRIAAILTLAVVVFAAAAMIFGGGQLVLMAFELQQMNAGLGICIGWIYLALPVSGLLIGFYGICQLISLWLEQTLPELGEF
jgi:TRAP-type C4-dicarboxylate transport system permease small subunit